MSKRRKRNPGLTDDLVIVGVLGVAAFFGVRALKSTLDTVQLPGLPTISSPIVTPGSVTPTNVLGLSVCDQIAFWRTNTATGIFGTGIFGANPKDWNAFRGWMIGTFGLGSDPGANPPSCW